jgi:hypothetical protein
MVVVGLEGASGLWATRSIGLASLFDEGRGHRLVEGCISAWWSFFVLRRLVRQS